MTDLLDLVAGINESCTKLEDLGNANKVEVAKIRMDLDIIYQKYAKPMAVQKDDQRFAREQIQEFLKEEGK